MNLVGHELLHQRARDVHRRFSRARSATPEVNETQMRAAAHHFIGRHSGVEPAGKQAEHAGRSVFSRQSAGARNFSRVNQHRSGRDFDAAGEIGFVELHANLAAGRAQVVEQIAAHVRFDLRSAQGKGFVAALGAHRKTRKCQRLDLRPCRSAKRVQIVGRAASDDAGHAEVGDAHDALDRRDHRLERRVVG